MMEKIVDLSQMENQVTEFGDSAAIGGLLIEVTHLAKPHVGRTQHQLKN